MGLNEALALAHRGLRVFPLGHNSNKPKWEGWTEFASNDPQSVVEMFTSERNHDGSFRPLPYDPGYNVGVLTNGMVVVDVDVKDGRQGWASFMRLDPDINTFTVETPSGGRHYYYDTLGTSWANSAGRLGEGLDTRSFNGYVVGPGSEINGRTYKTIYDPGKYAPIPPDVLSQLRPPREKNTTQNDFDMLDDPRIVQRAIGYLEELAPSYHGQQSQDVYDAGCMLRDFGVSEETAVSLMMQHWNERNEPPLHVDDLSRRVENAYLYASGIAGSKSALHIFEHVKLTPPVVETGNVSLDERQAVQDTIIENEDGPRGFYFGNMTPRQKLKPRPWLVNDLLLAGDVTTLAAAGAGGKTTFLLNCAIQLALGAETVMGYTNACAGTPVRSIIHSAEDDIDELSRRIEGSCVLHGLDASKVAPYIALSSGKDRDMKFAVMDNAGQPMAGTAAVEAICELAAQGNVGLIGLDPLANLHTLNENDSVQMTFLMSVFNLLAKETGAAVMVMHHTHKSSDGTVSGSRGSGAIVNSSRISLVLNSVSDKDAAEQGIPAKDIPRISWMGEGKSNVSEKKGARRWFIMRSVQLWTGDKVGVPCVYDIRTAQNGTDERIARSVREHMDSDGQTRISVPLAVKWLRGVAGEDLFAKISAPEGEMLLRQIIRRCTKELELATDGSIVLPGMASATVIPFRRST